jgi:hypothetical protein
MTNICLQSISRKTDVQSSSELRRLVLVLTLFLNAQRKESDTYIVIQKNKRLLEYLVSFDSTFVACG